MQQLKNIYVVDNSQVDLKAICATLKGLDVNVYSFLDPREALDNMSKVAPDIILLDYCMPEMTGAEFMIEVSERLLHNPNWQVFLVSGKDFDEEEQAGMLTLGILKVFKKPLQKAQLLEAIDHFGQNKLS